MKSKKNLSYPDKTSGSVAAKKLRREASKLPETQRESLFQFGMQIIYGGNGKKQTVGSRH